MKNETENETKTETIPKKSEKLTPNEYDEPEVRRFGTPIDLDKLPSTEINVGFEKIVVDKPTKGKVLSAVPLDSGEEGSDSQGDKFTRAYLQVKTQLDDKREIQDNYGGLRFYGDHIYIGESSDLGKLVAMVELEYEMTDGKRDLKRIINALVGSDVTVFPEKREFMGKTTSKNIIKKVKTPQ